MNLPKICVIHLLPFLFIAFSSPSYAQDLAAKTLALPAFTAISLETVGDLTIENDTRHSLTVEAEPKVLALITARVEGKVLRIVSSGDFKTDKPIKLKVSLSKLQEIALRSSGDILIANWKTDKLDCVVFGSGSIKAKGIVAEKIKVKIEGSGDIALEGHVTNFQAELDGTGTIEASKLIASSATASIGGAGNINLQVTNSLKATVNGSGTIAYLGNPKLTSSILGVGDIVQQ